MSQRNEGQDESSESFDSWLQRAARLTPWPVTHQLHPGMELCKGRLQLLRRLGAGGMGVVYEAFDRERGGEVAVACAGRAMLCSRWHPPSPA